LDTLVRISFAPIAQLVELLPFKEKVPGSSPGGRTMENTKLQPVSQLVKGSLQLYRERFATFKKLAFALFLINLLVGITAPEGTSSTSLLVGGGLYLLVCIVVAIVTYIGAISMTYVIGTGQHLSLREMWLFGCKKAWPYFLSLFLSGLVILGGFILLVIPGIIWMIQLLFVGAVVIFEDVRGKAALRQSRHYVKGHWWAVLLRGIVLLIVLIPVYILMGLLSFLPGMLFVIVTLILNFFVITPFSITYLYKLYVDLKS
jgi:hypothetical protein